MPDPTPAPAPTGPWWHAFGRVRDLAAPGEEPAEVWQLAVISPSTVPPEQVQLVGGPGAAVSWGDYLTSFDHEPTDAEKDALAPEAFRDDPSPEPLETSVPEPTTDPGPDQLPFRLMGLSCDAPGPGYCEADVRADIRADTREQAFTGIRDHGRSLGWQVSDDAGHALCPDHRPLLGVPAAPGGAE